MPGNLRSEPLLLRVRGTTDQLEDRYLGMVEGVGQIPPGLLFYGVEHVQDLSIRDKLH